MLKIGTSGYSFPDWKGTVYPKNVRQAEILEYYAYQLKFDTVEINFTGISTRFKQRNLLEKTTRIPCCYQRKSSQENA